MKPLLISVLSFAIFPALAVIAGGAVAAWRAPGAVMRSAIQHFAAGVIFCVLATELLPDLLHRRMPWITVIGFSVGVAVMLAVKHFSEKSEKRSEAKKDGNTGLIVAMGIDVTLDGLLIGLGFAAGQKQGMLLTIAMVLEVFFLGVAVATSLTKDAVSIGRTLRTTGMLGALILVGAGAGATAVATLPPALVDGLLAFGVAALLYLVTEELLVEAHEEPETPFQTAMFFVGFIVLFTVDMLV
jgi:ZIP family zinc transporter